MRALAVLAILLTAAACKHDERQPAPAEPASARAPEARAVSGDLLSPEQVTALLRGIDSDEWFGMYMAERKVGFARVQARPSGDGEPGAFSQHFDVVLGVGEDRSEWSESLYYAAEPPHRLLELRAREVSDDGRVERRYENGNARMLVTETIDGQPRPPRRLPASRATAAAAVAEYLEPGELEVGQQSSFFEFDSETERDERATLEVIARERRRVAGVDTEIATLRSRTDGEDASAEIVVAEGGRSLAVRLGDGVEMRLEAEDVARSEVRGLDVVGMAVPVSRALGDPAAIDELRLIAELPDGFSLPSAPNQSVRPRADGRHDIALRRAPGAEVSEGELREALEPTQGIDARHPSVVAAAATITAGARTPQQKVERLVAWVYETLEKDLTTSLSVASQILERRVGDCSEHSRLFVALARAAGLPAREVSGLVYMGDEVQRFGWHAWAEVALDGHWVPVDPSWGEALANATHLTLGTGDDGDWIMTVGSMRLEAPE